MRTATESMKDYCPICYHNTDDCDYLFMTDAKRWVETHVGVETVAEPESKLSSLRFLDTGRDEE